MKRYILGSHGGRGFGWEEMDEYAAGPWVRYEDVEKLQAELAAAKELLARVFGKWCTQEEETGVDFYQDVCACGHQTSGCNLIEHSYGDLPIKGRRPDCPYLHWEEKR